ncbi:MAG: AAA family ATPase, partial [Solobacterium sp.]|nr:AAA family ATPase [Solobacterium sp.]
FCKEISDTDSTGKAVSKVEIKASIKDNLIKVYSSMYSEIKITDSEFIKKINDNQLFNSQIESLIVAFELIWKIARVDFTNPDRPTTSERTGGARYAKKMVFTSNIDIIGSLLMVSSDAINRVLLHWLGIDIMFEPSAEKALKITLTALSEESVYKLVDDGKDVLFNENELYKKAISLVDDSTSSESGVDISGDKEPKGPLRILKSAITDGLNPYLSSGSNGITIARDVDINDFKEYQARTEAYARITLPKHIDMEEPKMDTDKKEIKYYSELRLKKDFPRNRIVFGAPGTGKSYKLDGDKNSLLSAVEDYERVTFHPDYTYSKFVGAYKPVSDDKGIGYEFVPGPFIRILVKALKSIMTGSPKPYLLLIEEINRAPVAAVFGEVFQLLDRKDDGTSQYEIETSEDLRKYLAKGLGVSQEQVEKIKIPNNMFIWATMNSADQGVFPMDTAFKRRWDFTYLGIDDNEKGIEGIRVTIGKEKQTFEWNSLRQAINIFLADDLKVNEDKQLGPYFLSKEKITDSEKFADAFKNKVLIYLFEDAARQRRNELFDGVKEEKNRYSHICDEFDRQGIKIFNKKIVDAVPLLSSTESTEEDSAQ